MGQKATSDILEPETHRMIVKKHRRITEEVFKRLEQAKINTISVEPHELLGRYLARDVVDPETGEMVAECNEEVTEKLLEKFKERKIEAFEILFIDNINVSSSLRDTLVMDKIELSREEREKLALAEPGKSQPGEGIGEGLDRYLQEASARGSPHHRDGDGRLFYNLFFNSERYDLSKVGRMK